MGDRPVQDRRIRGRATRHGGRAGDAVGERTPRRGPCPARANAHRPDEPAPDAQQLGELAHQLFEYMAAGLPILMHDNPFWLELACGAAIPVNIEAPASIATGLAELAADGARRAQLGACGRALIHQRYDWRDQEKQLLAEVARLIGPPAAREGESDP